MKAFKILAAFAAAASLWACAEKDNPTKPDDKPDDKQTETPAVSVSPTSVAFEADGGTLRVAVTTNVDSYSVTGNPDWLTCQVSGKEISLTAAQNIVAEVRNCTLTVTAETATCNIEVSQKAGSPYPGYAFLKSAKVDYGGTMLYGFMKPTEEDYGGWATMELVDDEDNEVVVWMYTDLFTSAEEVELTPGLYVKGEDDYLNLKLCAKKLTYMPGVTVSGEDEDDNYTTGTYFISSSTGQEIPLVDGTIEVIKEGEGFVIKVDLTDAKGTAYKYVYTGDVPVDAEGATYPTDRVDVANTVFGAVCYYKGDVYNNGTIQMALQLFSGNQESPATTNFDFYIPAVDFAEDLDISGNYVTPDEEEGPAPHTAGAIDFGVMVDYGFFQYPSGAFIMYEFGDYLVADGYASLMLTRQEDGKYTLSAALMSTKGEMVMFMGADFTGLHDLEIPIVDVRENGGEED